MLSTKYTQLPDLTFLLLGHFTTPVFSIGRHVDIRLVNGEELTEEDVERELAGADGILSLAALVFGVEGKDGCYSSCSGVKIPLPGLSLVSRWLSY